VKRVVPTVRHIEAILERALREYEAASEADTREFFLLKLQVLIFYFDVMAGILTLGRNKSLGFAKALAMKSLVHNLYEYDQQMNLTLVPRVMRYASKQKRPIDTSLIKAERRKWREQLARLKSWKPVRDAATAHYGRDIEQQVRLLKALGQEEVLSVSTAFVEYSAFILKLLPHRKRGDA
jgi:hypothetical protein